MKYEEAVQLNEGLKEDAAQFKKEQNQLRDTLKQRDQELTRLRGLQQRVAATSTYYSKPLATERVLDNIDIEYSRQPPELGGRNEITPIRLGAMKSPFYPSEAKRGAARKTEARSSEPILTNPIVKQEPGRSASVVKGMIDQATARVNNTRSRGKIHAQFATPIRTLVKRDIAELSKLSLRLIKQA